MIKNKLFVKGGCPFSYKFIIFLNEINKLEDFDIDRRQFTAEVLAQYASLAKEARKSGQLTVALGCINSMAKVGQVMS